MNRTIRALAALAVATVAALFVPSAAQAAGTGLVMHRAEASCWQSSLLAGIENTTNTIKKFRVEFQNNGVTSNYYYAIDPAINRWAYADYTGVSGKYRLRLYAEGSLLHTTYGTHRCDIRFKWERRGKYVRITMKNVGTAYADVITTRYKPSPWQEHTNFPMPGRSVWRSYFVGTKGFRLAVEVDGTNIRSTLVGSR